MQGTMLWFNEIKDFGFIRTDDGERLYVPGTGFAGGTRPQGRCARALVSFEVTETDGRRAEEVVFVPDANPRRARRRSRSTRLRD
jgi:hypothetical protein